MVCPPDDDAGFVVVVSAAAEPDAPLADDVQGALKDAEQQVQIFERGVLKAFVTTDGEAARSDES